MKIVVIHRQLIVWNYLCKQFHSNFNAAEYRIKLQMSSENASDKREKNIRLQTILNCCELISRENRSVFSRRSIYEHVLILSYHPWGVIFHSNARVCFLSKIIFNESRGINFQIRWLLSGATILAGRQIKKLLKQNVGTKSRVFWSWALIERQNSLERESAVASASIVRRKFERRRTLSSYI